MLHVPEPTLSGAGAAASIKCAAVSDVSRDMIEEGVCRHRAGATEACSAKP